MRFGGAGHLGAGLRGLQAHWVPYGIRHWSEQPDECRKAGPECGDQQQEDHYAAGGGELTWPRGGFRPGLPEDAWSIILQAISAHSNRHFCPVDVTGKTSDADLFSAHSGRGRNIHNPTCRRAAAIPRHHLPGGAVQCSLNRFSLSRKSIWFLDARSWRTQFPASSPWSWCRRHCQCRLRVVVFARTADRTQRTRLRVIEVWHDVQCRGSDDGVTGVRPQGTRERCRRMNSARRMPLA
jgi:hypothetical protein